MTSQMFGLMQHQLCLCLGIQVKSVLCLLPNGRKRCNKTQLWTLALCEVTNGTDTSPRVRGDAPLRRFLSQSVGFNGKPKARIWLHAANRWLKMLLFIPFGIFMLIFSSSGFNCLYVSGCLRVLLCSCNNDSQVFLPDLLKSQVFWILPSFNICGTISPNSKLCLL